MSEQTYKRCSGCKYMLLPCNENGTLIVSGIDSELSCALKQENARLKKLNQELMDALEWVCGSQCRDGDSPDEDHCDSLLNYPCPVKMAYMKAKEVQGE